MLITTSRILFVAAAFLGAALTKAEAEDARLSPFMQVTGPTSQPIGHYEFCERNRRECEERSTSAAAVTLTEGLWRQLLAVNDRVNGAIAPVTDQEMFGEPEVWFFPTREGDCEDYALLKRRELMALGWPAGALLITVVRQLDGEGHAVLTVRTDRGDLILDNLQAEIVAWNQTSYTYVKRQSERDSGRWMSIADERPLVVGPVGR